MVGSIGLGSGVDRLKGVSPKASKSELIKQVRLINPSNAEDRIADIWVRDGCIAAIADSISEVPEHTELIAGEGAVLGPGLVDLYSYSGEPGYESRETLPSLLNQAIAGGFTRLNILPHTQPPIDHPGAIQQFRQRLPQVTPVQVNVWGAMTQGIGGTKLTELLELHALGITGFSDGSPITDWVLIQRFLEYAQPLNSPVALWPCLSALAGEGVIREGLQSIQFGLPAMTVAAETSAIAAILQIAVAYDTPIHLMRISTAQGVNLIGSAKAQGVRITASTPWTHLIWNSNDLRHYDPMLRLDPPLGNPEDQQTIIQGLETGVIDAIAIDHHTYTYEEKTVPFATAPPGYPGLGVAFPLLWERFVESNQWSAIQMWQMLSLNPSRCLQQSPSCVQVGHPAEMFLFHPAQSSPVTRKPWDSTLAIASPQPAKHQIRTIWGQGLWQSVD